MQPEGTSIRYTPTRADLLAFHTRAVLCNRVLLGLAACCFLFIVIVDILRPSAPDVPLAVNVIAAVIAGLIAVICGAIVGCLFLVVTVWTGKFKNVLTEQTVSITPEGLAGTSALGEGLLRWAGIHKVVSTKRLLIIYTNETTARIIPKRCFPTPEAASAFEQDLRSRLQPH